MVSLAKALNSASTCTNYVMPYDQCGGSAGGCYGHQCKVRCSTKRLSKKLHALATPLHGGTGLFLAFLPL